MRRIDEIDNLPATLSARDINKYLRFCGAETLRDALEAGRIKGKRINGKRIAYETKSVLQWLGLAEPADK